MTDTNKPIHYIRKNRKDEAMIYLKDNDQRAAQKMFCYMYATEHNVDILGETTNIEEVKNCNVMLIASASMLTRDANEYYKIEKKLKKKGIRIEIATSGDNADRYVDMMLKLSRKGRI